jgi:hypothetical protein
MKKYSSALFVCSLAFVLFTLINGCEKDIQAKPVTVSKSLTEEFDTVANLYRKGWIFVNNSRPQGSATWQQGIYTAINGKTGITFDGFPAYSFGGSADEYILAGYMSGNDIAELSSWMITPVLEFKNSDKISFYTRSAGTYADRLQVWLNTDDTNPYVGQTATSVGSFHKLLLDINPSLQTGTAGYPTTWTRYQFTIDNMPSPRKGRIAFRYYVPAGGPNGANSNAIGIDKFEFSSN